MSRRKRGNNPPDDSDPSGPETPEEARPPSQARPPNHAGAGEGPEAPKPPAKLTRSERRLRHKAALTAAASPERTAQRAAKKAAKKAARQALLKAEAAERAAWEAGAPRRPKRIKKPPAERPPEPPDRIRRPKVQEEVERLLDKIGVPDLQPLKPDPFQLKAAKLVQEHDVIVSAPTGSGKTWIAKRALDHEMSLGRRSWYASPLKALSNSKYLEFGREFGREEVGLLTGDHKINTKAPILVGTTEILRNQLYDAMSGRVELDVDLVVLDEAHYIGDDERGVVWEEILIYMPARVRFLLLSATVENAKELAAWLGHNRGRPVKVVQGGERPVPLEPLCLDNGHLTSLGKLPPEWAREESRRWRGGRPDIPPESRLGELASLNLLPAIFFLKSRRECDNAVQMAKRVPDDPARRRERGELVGAYAKAHPYLASYPGLSALVDDGLASHHAGHLPQFKMLVEELMSRNLLSAIFATSTVAAGVNFPARTVVIPQSDRFNGEFFAPLSATELAQMTGRAGRRGLDLIGFAVLLRGRHQDLRLMEGLFNSPPDPVRSALRMNFSMVLNLLRSYEIDLVPELLSRSLAAWQAVSGRHTRPRLKAAAEEMFESFMRHVEFLADEGLVLGDGRLTASGLTAAALRVQHPLILHAAIKGEGLPESPASLAAVMPVLSEERRPQTDDVELNRLMKSHPDLRRDFSKMVARIRPMVTKLARAGFPAPSNPDFRSCLAIHEWAVTNDYRRAARLLSHHSGYPGDLVRHVLLAGEHLNQLAALEGKPHERLALTAAEARRLIMVEPMI